MVCLTGAVEKTNGLLMLWIPLAVGGNELTECTEGIAEVRGEFLAVEIPEWLAEKLRIGEGDKVVVHNAEGKFNICRAAKEVVH